MTSIPKIESQWAVRLHSKKAACVACSILLLSTGAPSFAAGTVAGTDIQNIASATFDTANGPITVNSNTVSIKVDELLDVTVMTTDAGDIITNPGKSGNIQSFRITNTGNGDEAFVLTANTANGGDDFDPTLQQIVIDSNNNGVYDAGVDVVYVAGSNDPVVAPDQSQTVFVVTSTPAGVANSNRANVSLAAAALTGTGTPGTALAGQGQGGGNAVVGSTGGNGTANGFLAVQSTSLSFVKSVAIADPFGGTQPVPGAIVTYSLVATVTGAGTLNNLNITDPIPAGSAYQTESITLQSASAPVTVLTDAADADAGTFNGTGIAVSVGNVPAGETRTVTFKVVIQ